MDESTKPKISNKIVFLSRAETYFGRILAQHLSHAVIPEPNLNEAKTVQKDELLDLSFLDTAAEFGSFKVFGTWCPVEPSSPYEASKRPPRITAIQGMCPSDNYADIAKMVSAADICIFNLVDDDGHNDVYEDTIKAFGITKQVVQRQQTRKVLVLVSTILTWLNTKQIRLEPPLSQEETERKSKPVIFAEEEYRRRKPHPNYTGYYELEKQFLHLGSTCSFLCTTVIAAGVIYGYGENILNYLFRKAWLGKMLEIHEVGGSVIPTIHAKDLSQIVENVSTVETRNRYIIGVDEGEVTLESFSTELARSFGATDVESVNLDDLLMRNCITGMQYDLLTSDLRCESSTLRDGLKFTWLAKTGLMGAMKRVVEEYKASRNVLPIRISVIGPPFSGKTTVAKLLSESYKLPYLDPQVITVEAIAELEKIVSESFLDTANVDTKTSIKDISSKAAQLLELIAKDKEKNAGQISDVHVARFVHEKILTLPCQNQGYVLDGYPISYESGKDLFAPSRQQSLAATGKKDADRPKAGAENTASDITLLPEFVFYLDAPVDILKQEVLKSNRKETAPHVPVEYKIVQKFAEYNLVNTDEDSVLIYYDEIHVPVLMLDVTEDLKHSMVNTVRLIQKRIGPPRNFGLSKEEKNSVLRKEAERRVQQEKEDRKRKVFLDELAKADRERRQAQWKAELEDIRREFTKPEKRTSIPMRGYVMSYVLPDMIDALMECTAIRPADPIDFVADYLAKKSLPLYEKSGLVPFKEISSKVAKMRAKSGHYVNQETVLLPKVVILEDEEHLFREPDAVPLA